MRVTKRQNVQLEAGTIWVSRFLECVRQIWILQQGKFRRE